MCLPINEYYVLSHSETSWKAKFIKTNRQEKNINLFDITAGHRPKRKSFPVIGTYLHEHIEICAQRERRKNSALFRNCLHRLWKL